MDHLLGLQFSSVWMAFLYLMLFCVIGAPVERLLGRLARKIAGEGKIEKGIHLVLDVLANWAVLTVLDKVMGSITITWWTAALLAVAMALMLVVWTPKEGQQTDGQEPEDGEDS